MLRRHLLDLLNGIRGLVDKRTRTPVAENQMRLYLCFPEDLQEAYPENSSRGSGNTDDQSEWMFVHKCLAARSPIRDGRRLPSDETLGSANSNERPVERYRQEQHE